MAKHIPGRTGQQCAQRWRHRVNPNIRREKWTPEEDRLLMRLVHQHGSAWAEISRGLEVRGMPLCCSALRVQHWPSKNWPHVAGNRVHPAIRRAAVPSSTNTDSSYRASEREGCRGS